MLYIFRFGNWCIEYAKLTLFCKFCSYGIRRVKSKDYYSCCDLDMTFIVVDKILLKKRRKQAEF